MLYEIEIGSQMNIYHEIFAVFHRSGIPVHLLTNPSRPSIHTPKS
jgi:hypothetical protein